MGRKLRSGKQIASLSPPTKRGGKVVVNSNNANTKKQQQQTKRAPTKLVAKKTGSKKAKKHQAKDEEESSSSSGEEEEEEEENNVVKTKQGKEEEDGSESESESDDVGKPTPLKKSNVVSSVKSNKKTEEKNSSSSSEEESEDGDSDGDDDGKDKGFTDGTYMYGLAFILVLPFNYYTHYISILIQQHNTLTSSIPIENADWLKPKQQQSKMKLLDSDDDDDEDGEEANDDEFGAESDDDDDDMLEVERQSRLLDAEMKLEQEEADLELRRTIAQQTSIFHLPTHEEIAEEENRVVPPSELRARIEDVLEVLADFKNRRESGRSRSEYIERLAQDMAELFGYLQELVDYFLSMFGPNECLEFLEASDKNRPLVVRVNTLKARRKDLAAALMKRGVRLDPLAPWSKVGLKIYESTVPIGATPEYLAGHYMLQSAASMCPVMALGPQPGDRVMDMSAAPGGKTSYISQLMRNKGIVIANDSKPERQKATVANLHRLGVRNTVTCCYDGRKLGSQMRNSFDRILLDAPCSGLGVISRDPSVKVQRTMPDVLRCAHLQKELLVAAIDALNHKSKKGGGYMVYSTCSVAVAENEEVINYLLSKRDVKLVDTGLDFGMLCLVVLNLLHCSFFPH